MIALFVSTKRSSDKFIWKQNSPLGPSNQVIVVGIDVVSTGGDANEHGEDYGDVK